MTHMQSQHSERKPVQKTFIKCWKCDLFFTQNALQKHQMTCLVGLGQPAVMVPSESFSCSDCGAVFDTEAKYNDHWDTTHKITDFKSSPTHDEEQPDFEPSLDEEPVSLRAEDLLQAKIEADSDDDASVSQPEPVYEDFPSDPMDEGPSQLNQTANKSFICDQCHKSFRYYKSYQKHRALHFKLFKCGGCDKVFRKLRYMREHAARCKQFKQKLEELKLRAKQRQ